MIRIAAIAALAAPLCLISMAPSSAALPYRAEKGSSQIAAKSPEIYEEARGGCGSRGGPGYRKANGKCAGWSG